MGCRLFILFGALALIAGLAPGAPVRATPPNVVLITIDTLRADHVGCYGDREARTPNLDALARDGVLFRTVVAAVPLTLPSHCSILTGTYPTLHGVRDNLGYVLGDAPPTLASILKQHGYTTAAFVAADVLDPRRGLNRGFDAYSCPLRRKIGHDNPLVFNLQELRRPAESVVTEALDWMAANETQAGKPFFVWIHLYDPHSPYEAPDRFRSLVRNAYDGAVAYADETLGKVFDYLKRKGLYDSSLIVATSDHGESFGEHGEYTHGYFVYDTTLLVPLIIKPPAGSAVAPRAVSQPVRSIDIAPTIVQLLGMPAALTMQGSGLVSLMRGLPNTKPIDAAYSETYYPTEFGWSTLRALRKGRLKYIDAPKPELYDLAVDPGELHNLFQSRQALAFELRGEFNILVTKVTPRQTPRPAPVSPMDIEMLASLGYVGGSSAISGTGHEHLPDPKDELKTFKVLLSATHLAAEKQCDRAIPLLASLTQQEPGLFLGHLTLAKCQLYTTQYDSASRSLDGALRLRPDNLEARFYEGICRFQQGRFDDALSSLKGVERDLPGEAYVHFYVGMIYEQQQKLELALAEFQACTKIDPDFEVAVYKVGYYLAKAGRFQDAAVQFKKVIALDPYNAAAHRNLGLAYAKSGADAAARPEFETACRLSAAMCLSDTRP